MARAVASVGTANRAAREEDLRARVIVLEAQLNAERARADKLAADHARLLAAYQQVELELKLLRRRIFVASAERVDTKQLDLEFADKQTELADLAAKLDAATPPASTPASPEALAPASPELRLQRLPRLRRRRPSRRPSPRAGATCAPCPSRRRSGTSSSTPRSRARPSGSASRRAPSSAGARAARCASSSRAPSTGPRATRASPRSPPRRCRRGPSRAPWRHRRCSRRSSSTSSATACRSTARRSASRARASTSTAARCAGGSRTRE